MTNYCKNVTGSTGLPTGWNYVGFSAEMSQGKDTILKIWVNTVQEGTSTNFNISARPRILQGRRRTNYWCYNLQ